jgi:hypothetical protein
VGHIHVLNGVAVARHPLLGVVESPVLTQNRLQQVRVRTGRNAVYCIVRAHKGSNVTADAALETWQVVLDKVLLGDLGVELVSEVTVPVLDIVTGKVLAGRHNSFILIARVSLETLDQSAYIRRQMVRIFTRGLLATGVLHCS